jgi:hypothetical protein
MSLTYDQQMYFRRSAGDLGSPEAPLNWKSDTFLGDGSTLVFTLSHTPDQTNYTPTVTVSGGLQNGEQFSIATATLTFVSAPSNNAPIEVNYQY